MENQEDYLKLLAELIHILVRDDPTFDTKVFNLLNMKLTLLVKDYNVPNFPTIEIRRRELKENIRDNFYLTKNIYDVYYYYKQNDELIYKLRMDTHGIIQQNYPSAQVYYNPWKNTIFNPSGYGQLMPIDNNLRYTIENQCLKENTPFEPKSFQSTVWAPTLDIKDRIPGIEIVQHIERPYLGTFLLETHYHFSLEDRNPLTVQAEYQTTKRIESLIDQWIARQLTPKDGIIHGTCVLAFRERFPPRNNTKKAQAVQLEKRKKQLLFVLWSIFILYIGILYIG